MLDSPAPYIKDGHHLAGPIAAEAELPRSEASANAENSAVADALGIRQLRLGQ
jgi:hypothetical protein